MSRNISKRIDLSDLEAKILKMKADQCHLSEADYLRELIMNSQPVEAPPRQFYVQMEKVNRIASTIQRICATAQDKAGIDELKSLYVQLIGHIVEIKECVSKARFFALTAYQDWEHQVELAKREGRIPPPLESIMIRDKSTDIEDPATDPKLGWNALGIRETAVYGVMCALMAESGCSPTATEATGKWGISAADYTAQVNDGTVSKEEFFNSTYNGVQGARGYGIAQRSTTDRKKALYEFAESWATEKGETFDIGGIDMQVAHLQETINTSYPSMKEALIKEKDIVAACYLWISTYEKPSEKYSTWQEKAENDVDKFEEDLRTECSVRAIQGIFLWPCPSSKSITSYFDNRVAPKAGASTDHKGIDIGASMGESVIAAAAGKVTTVAYSGARGYYIVVDHGNGYATLYQHLSRQDVRTGDMVTAGQQIGAVGETGISTAPHLHFEVHVNGTPVNLLQYYD